ncbi:MAG: bifunctional diaminohydroxyphosphoribosylaminopyrimidine deaminase/5-amino-6-(5-phosphoribosylamino)uracil reductase RibD [Ilumatobacter sp.]|nr:bifunctional diaminohydroxyphosphoribosylaminopyrimidine deaminase/5-amino-6-(5-phosphoribosylamino)uracil reductase RibD [Ilumatobacter sp.]MDG2040983.1 bifunctional diaminohydroxyphosphoribosylaminopyrimidine deaminase/5-amino-6-(5-phosphoribosylamino)uracil reductase RibD [Ilumatobacter sp.]
MTSDDKLMQEALAAAESARLLAAPNPWVGAAIESPSGSFHLGATEAPGGDHAEIVALRSAGYDAQGSTLATTLEPCSHVGRTGACVEAIIKAGVSRVVVGVIDPDQQVDGTGVDRLRAAGIDVVVGIRAIEAAEQLAPYLHHRRTGRPYVVVKLAATVDGRTAAPDASSKWITGVEARTDGHRLRAESQAILVGSGTIRSDDPALTTRMVDGPNPRRIVLGSAPPDARVHPCLEWRGEIGGLLDLLGQEGVLQLMIEGGPNTIAQFHAEHLVNRYVLYLAPAIFGGNDAKPMFSGDGAPTIETLSRGRFVGMRHVGADLRLDVELD